MFYTVWISEDLVRVKLGKLAQTSIYIRLEKIQKFKCLWAGIPHPDADKLAKENNVSINYNWMDFLKLNNKIMQKKTIKRNTPEFIIVQDFTHLKNILAKDNEFFLKRNLGSGGFTSFDCTKSKIKDFKKFKEIEFLRDILEQGKTLFKHYNGFFGLDFIFNNRAYFLEFNVRLTAATIPVLLTNAFGWKQSVYLENETKLKKNDLILTNTEDKYDILRRANG